MTNNDGRRMRIAAVVMVGLTLALVGCGGGDKANPLVSSPAASSTPTTAAAATAPATMTFDGAVTDNYKACFNADKDAYDERTWFSMVSLDAGGIVYTVVDDGSGMDAFVDAATGVVLNGSDGSTATLRATASPTSTARLNGHFRSKGQHFGYLGYVASRDALQAHPLHVDFTLIRDGSAIATGSADYALDATLAAAAPNTPEFNGPAGRWSTSGVATKTDVEIKPYTCD